jgi:hypothetical protein
MRIRQPLIAAITLVSIASIASAHTTVYQTVMNGANESPVNASPGTGSATVTLDLDLVTMRVQADFSGLLGNTTQAHIHGLTTTPLTGTASVLSVTPSFTGFPLGVTAGTYDHTFDMTLASSYNAPFITANGGTVSGALNALTLGLDTGRTYFNIHSSSFGSGEIRGFLVAVPEPTSVATVVGGAVLIGRRIRRRA